MLLNGFDKRRKIKKMGRKGRINLNWIFFEEKTGRKSQHVHTGRIITFLHRP